MQRLPFSARRHARQRHVARSLPLAPGVLALLLAGVLLAACLPDPPPNNLPTQPAILDITPAPTLDIDATATVLAIELRPTPTPAGLHVVQPGDTLGSLAELYNTTVEEIMATNGLDDPNTLQVGQELIIPSLVEVTPEITTPTPTITPTLAITLTTP
jgi:LysM repeat protein